MQIAHVLTVAAALAGSAALFTPAGADEVCDKNCVGPACSATCTYSCGRGLKPVIHRPQEPSVREVDPLESWRRSAKASSCSSPI
jgi:hypothetical protein